MIEESSSSIKKRTRFAKADNEQQTSRLHEQFLFTDKRKFSVDKIKWNASSTPKWYLDGGILTLFNAI
jgi:hypothetical protein